MIGKARRVTELWVDGGYAGPKLEKALKRRGLRSITGTARKPKDTRGFTTLPPLGGGRAFAWMSRCRRLAKGSGRILAGSLAWGRPAACRFPDAAGGTGANAMKANEKARKMTYDSSSEAVVLQDAAHGGDGRPQPPGQRRRRPVPGAPGGGSGPASARPSAPACPSGA